MALKEDLQKYWKKGVEVSKQAFSKAESAVTKFGDESVLKIEIRQLKSKLTKEITALGEAALDTFAEKSTINEDQEPFATRLTAIKEIKAEIQKREDLLKDTAQTVDTTEQQK